MAVPSPVGDVKIVSSIVTLVLNTWTFKCKAFFSLWDMIKGIPDNNSVAVIFRHNL